MNEGKKATPHALVIHGGSYPKLHNRAKDIVMPPPLKICGCFLTKLHNRAEDVVIPPPLIICGGSHPKKYEKRRTKDDGA